MTKPKKPTLQDVMEAIKHDTNMDMNQVNEKLAELGFTSSYSSQISLARRKLGIPKRTNHKQGSRIQLEDLEKIKDLPTVLGYTIPETIEIIQAVEKHCLQVGGTGRAIEVLKKLEQLKA